MVPSTREGYRYLQVDRPVQTKLPQFLSRVAYLGVRIFGTEPRASITETGFEFAETRAGNSVPLEPSTRAVTICESVINVYSQDDLSLVLLRKLTPLHVTRHNFNAYAAEFTARSSPGYQKKKNQKQPKETLRDALHTISRHHDVNPLEMTLQCSELVEYNDLGRGSELALVPRIGSVATTVLREQSALCSEQLLRMSQNAAYPSSPQVPAIPFMRIPEEVTDRQYERFINEVGALLPQSVVIGDIDAHSRSVSGKGC